MPKKLRISNIDSKFSITVRELNGFLQNLGGQPATENKTPIVLKCGGRNYRLYAMRDERGTPVLVGRRGKRD